jgi:predicted RNA-binding Zn-ribbon protein involved in translation (DUF1610 family)
VLVWLFWILVLVVAAVLVIWTLLIGVVVIGGMASSELCPRCGVSLGITDRDRFLDYYLNPKYNSGAMHSCARCGWRSSDGNSGPR